MLHYIIDGNNLIGKLNFLKNLPDKQSAREKIVLMLERFFTERKATVNLYFDGFENEPIKSSRIKIKYSLSRTADELIKKEVENLKNTKSAIVVSSDSEIISFAKACGCKILKSEEFYNQIVQFSDKNYNNEKPIDFNTDEFKKLFGIE